MSFSLNEIHSFDTDINPLLTSLDHINYNLPMQRDNHSWLADLRAEGNRREDAINDLRVIIMRVLPGPLSRYLSPESGHFDAFLEDVAQETLLRVLDRLETFQGRSNFTTWVYKIAINIALGELRLRKWKEFSLDKLEEGQDPDQMPSEIFAADDPNPEMTLEQKEAMSLVQKILREELTPRQRSVMMAVNIQGVPMDVVADRVGSNRNALYKMMHDARLKLKRRLEREGFSPEEILNLFGK
jgi:RNA polymerase sigma-70 factor (ECF subfamily)